MFGIDARTLPFLLLGLKDRIPTAQHRPTNRLDSEAMFAAPLAALALAATALPAWSIVTPTSPDSTTVVKVGDQITAMWDVDPTGTWTDMEIQLMTGPNSPVSLLHCWPPRRDALYGTSGLGITRKEG